MGQQVWVVETVLVERGKSEVRVVGKSVSRNKIVDTIVNTDRGFFVLGGMAAFILEFALLEMFTPTWWLTNVWRSFLAAVFIAWGTFVITENYSTKQLPAIPIRWTSTKDGSAKLKCAQTFLKRLSHGSYSFDSLPQELCEAFDRLVDVSNTEGTTNEYARDRLCDHLNDLLNDGEAYEDVLIVLHTVASTDNPATMETARRSVHKLFDMWQIEQNNALEAKKVREVEAKKAEQERQRELAEAQPDYSEELVGLVQRRAEVMAQLT